jgi:hypothetical protein
MMTSIEGAKCHAQVYSNASVTCAAGQGSPVNILEIYPGLGAGASDTIVDACLCFSQFSGPTCSGM